MGEEGKGTYLQTRPSPHPPSHKLRQRLQRLERDIRPLRILVCIDLPEERDEDEDERAVGDDGDAPGHAWVEDDEAAAWTLDQADEPEGMGVAVGGVEVVGEVEEREEDGAVEETSGSACIFAR